jgi:hypothetical protein
MRFQIEPTDRSENDWIPGCDARLCEFDQIICERDDKRVARQALQSSCFSQQLHHLT